MLFSLFPVSIGFTLTVSLQDCLMYPIVSWLCCYILFSLLLIYFFHFFIHLFTPLVYFVVALLGCIELGNHSSARVLLILKKN